MDIEKLRMYLKDEYSYQDTTKEIFLNEIDSIFVSHRNSGDTKLKLYPGKCMAESSECDGCGKNGYRLVGNISGNYVDLIFDVKEDDLKDIFHCSKFTSNEEVNNLANQASIYINDDDKVTFKKTVEYWIKVSLAQQAMDELIKTPPNIIDYKRLVYWLEKHASSKARIGEYYIFGPNMKWTPFLKLYSVLNEIKEYLQVHLKVLVQANKQIVTLTTEEAIIEWLMLYQQHYEASSYEMLYLMSENQNYIVLDHSQKIYFQGREFKEIFIFLDFYHKQYYPLLDKYSTYNIMERNEAFNDFESQKKGIDITSLRFHLEKRKAMEEIGIKIPLYITKTEDPPF